MGAALASLRAGMLLTLQDPTCWAVKMEVLKIAVCLISYFTRLLGDALPALLAACWKLFMGEGVAIYQVRPERRQCGHRLSASTTV
jgi:hypothetical protein